MDMLVCPDVETKPQSQRDMTEYVSPREWWQVTYTLKDIEKTKVYRSSDRAACESDELFEKGIACRIEPCRTDVYIVDGSGEILLVATRRNPREASKFSFDYAREPNAGILEHCRCNG